MTWDRITAEAAARFAGCLWSVLLVVWVVLWLGMKRAKKRESPLEMLQHAIPVTLGFWLMFGRRENWGWLNERVLPNIPALWLAGLVVTALGIAISIYARLSLGANWSGVVTLKTDHELIRKGLYSRIRHPIYTGILLGMVGTVMIRSYLRSCIGFGMVLTTFYFKARREERFLKQEFGAGFDEHARQTGMFLPKCRSGGSK
jgi:protein-S-isoprenylcysteine O-methyltransferase Ste14